MGLRYATLTLGTHIKKAARKLIQSGLKITELEDFLERIIKKDFEKCNFWENEAIGENNARDNQKDTWNQEKLYVLLWWKVNSDVW